LSDLSIYRTSPATNLFVAVHCTFAPKKFFAASNTDVTVWSVFGHCKKKVLLGAGFAGAAIAANLPNARLRTRSRLSPTAERVARARFSPLAERRGRAARRSPRVSRRHARRLATRALHRPAAPSSALIRAAPPPSERRRRGAEPTPARLSTCTFLLHWRVTSVN